MCQEKEWAGQAGTPCFPHPTPPQGPPLSLGHSLSKEENTCPCPQKSDLKGQPLAFSAFPLRYSGEGHRNVCTSMSEMTAQAQGHKHCVTTLGTEARLARAEAQGD